MKWPWQSDKLETRAENSYTDVLVAALVSRAQGKTLAIPSATAALESCAGAVGRGFMAAEVMGRPMVAEALTPDCLEMVGRTLIRRGEMVYLIDLEGGRLRLLPADIWDVNGGPSPDSWEYRVTLSGPSRTLTHDHVSPDSVLHFRYASDATRPWRGNSPLEIASLAGKLSAETARQLGEESSGPVGRLLGLPVDGADPTVIALRKDIAEMAGRVAMVETGDWDNAGAGAVDLETKRFGAEPPQPLVNLLDVASREVVSACGFHPALFQVGPAAAIREAWRLALFGVVSPLGRKVETELQAKLDPSIKLGWQELRASDLSGRARAFQSMVGGGMAVQEAIAISGLMVED